MERYPSHVSSECDWVYRRAVSILPTTHGPPCWPTKASRQSATSAPRYLSRQGPLPPPATCLLQHPGLTRYRKGKSAGAARPWTAPAAPQLLRTTAWLAERQLDLPPVLPHPTTLPGRARLPHPFCYHQALEPPAPRRRRRSHEVGEAPRADVGRRGAGGGPQL